MEPPSRAIPGEKTAGIIGALFLPAMIMTIREIMIREKNRNFIKVKNQNMWRQSIEMNREYHKRILIRMILGVIQETGIDFYEVWIERIKSIIFLWSQIITKP